MARLKSKIKKTAAAKVKAKPTEFILSNNLKAMRHALYMSQTELGRMVGTGKSTISVWENHKRGIKDQHKIELCNALRCTVTQLFNWET